MKSVAKLSIRMAFSCLLALIPLVAGAVTVDGLYRAQVPVANTSASAQQAAYREGLRQVLMRVSGNREIVDSEEVAPLLDEAESLLQSYQFQRSPDGSDELLMTFGSVGVNRALADLQVPVWGANRPLTLSWIAVDSGRDRWVLTRDDDGLNERGRWARAFSEAAVKRGLPMVLPSSDVRNNRDLVSEIRGQFMDSLRAEASGYSHNLMTVVNISRRGSSWEARWLLEGPAFSETGEIRGEPSSEAVAVAVVDAWSDLLADRYSVDAGQVSESQRVDLVIDDIATVEDYGAVMSSLQRMTPVVSAGPVQASVDETTMRVAFSGELSVLKEYIALDKRFEPVAGEVEAVGVASQPSQSAADMSASTVGQAPDAGRQPEAAENPTASTEAAPQEGNQPVGDQGADVGLNYRPAASDAESADAGSDQDFESLYPVLHYRWVGDGAAQAAAE
ncbi:DUF2066 domain-containing protein [Marinobacter bohaiensis]|uniref:DUF2066 domain-containing protein n=1 Tax=Marinobacter bohaiensis TaxID=2201898 RepID=UPI000DADAB70|nr:DUF2066 domain-containing protein [Marinobacter bohaiensis]